MAKINIIATNQNDNICDENVDNNKEVWKKLKQLEYNLHGNNVHDKKHEHNKAGLALCLQHVICVLHKLRYKIQICNL